MNYKKTILFGLVFSVCIAGGYNVALGATPEQELWLNKRNRTVIVRPEKNYPPFVFMTNGTTKPLGLGVDYIELIAKKANVTLQYFDPAPLSSILSALKEGKDGIVLALTPTESRESFLYFTDPYINVPAVIVVRKDYPSRKQTLTLADFSGKRVAVGDAYAAEEYIKANYKKIIIDPVSDDEVGIQKILLGEVDAAVMDIASLSYYTANKALSYVTIAGQTGFEYSLSFAVPQQTPELHQILNAALTEITPQERQVIKDKWITPPGGANPTVVREFFGDNTLLVVASIIAGAIIFFISIILIIRAFRRMQVLSFVRRPSHLTHMKRETESEQFEDLKEELEKLEEASDLVEDELLQIKKLEHDIADKIKKLE